MLKKIRTLSLLLLSIILVCFSVGCKSEPKQVSQPPQQPSEKWTNNPILTWLLDGGSVTADGSPVPVPPATYEGGYEVVEGIIITAPTVERTGYDFNGWTPTPVAITMPSSNLTYTAQWKASEYTITYKDEDGATFTGKNSVSLPQKHAYGTVTTLIDGVRDGYIFKGWFTSSDCSGRAVTTLGATEYTANITLYAKWESDGLLSGVFSVSENTKVKFTKGNLQATYNGSDYTWGFAENQWDFIGNNEGNTTIANQSSGNVVDLFGWSTDGGTILFGISISQNNSDYSGVFKDWGKAIGDGKTYRTLTGGTSGEWRYLLNTRTVNGGQREGNSYQRAIINSDITGVFGMIIYPDNYTDQSGETTYSSSEWNEMETRGCVFLPAARIRSGSEVSIIADGNYWSSSPTSGNSYAYYLDFWSDGVSSVDYDDRYNGRSVRLVYLVE